MQWNFGDIIDSIVPILPEGHLALGAWRQGNYVARNERAHQ